MTGNRAALDRLLGGPETEWLLDRVRARIPAAAGEPLAGPVILTDPTESQRAAIARLTGTRSRSATRLRVDLGDVEQVLRRGPWPQGLADAVVTLTGPVVDKRAERDRDTVAWQHAAAHLEPVADDDLLRWWQTWCAAGNLKRAARSEAARRGAPAGPEIAGDLVRQLALVVSALPVASTPLSVFAGQVLGDAHALDEARPLGRLAVAVVGAAFTDGSSSSARDIWAAAGVIRSNVASTVLALGVPGVAVPDDDLSAATATVLEAMRGVRTPTVLTLDQVRSGGVAPLPADATVWVCENPTIVEVAAARGAASVLVCTSGQPSAAAIELLTILSSAGATVRYHGDFDWAGLRIATALAARVPWEPWRFGAGDYKSHVRRVRTSVPLSGPPAVAAWDADLAPAMHRAGVAIEEESVVETLVADLLSGA